MIESKEQVLDAFRGYNLKLVLQGHLHVVEEIIFRGVHFITGGAVCGAWWKGPRDGFPEGFVVVDVDKDVFSWRYETFGWKTQERALLRGLNCLAGTKRPRRETP